MNRGGKERRKKRETGRGSEQRREGEKKGETGRGSEQRREGEKKEGRNREMEFTTLSK